MSRTLQIGILVLVTTLAGGGCAASRAFNQGNAAVAMGDVDEAVAYYRAALQKDPNRPEYRIALERALVAASRTHLDRARAFEEAGQLEAARSEYRIASDYDRANLAAAAKVIALDRAIMRQAEAARPRPEIDQMRDRAQQATAVPVLDFGSGVRSNFRFNGAMMREALEAIAGEAGINITYDRDVTDRPVTLQLDDVTVEEAIRQVMLMNQLSYQALSSRSLFVFPDNTQKHTQYDQQVLQVFYIAHADPAELVQILTQLLRLPGIAIQPVIQMNKAANTIVVRATREMVDVIGRLIAQNDKPRAEIVIDVEILEVNRTRARQYGIDLAEYALGGVYSPSAVPTTPTLPSSVGVPPPINLSTITGGVSASDFYLAVPSAVVRFLETDTTTKLIAKPQLRGTEGAQLTLHLGDRIPVITTSYTPLATGGAGVNPLSSYDYEDVGVNIELLPRVTIEGDIVMDLTLDNSSLGPNVSVAGVSVPSFGQRTLTTRLRLRDGESNLLAGLLREDERQSLSSAPFISRIPVLRSLFGANDNSIAQTDIVMILTPHIIRTSEISEDDLKPIYIGSQQNFGLLDGPVTLGDPAVPAGASSAAAAIPPSQASAPAAGAVPAPVDFGASSAGARTQIVLSPPMTTFRVGGGPYTVALSARDAVPLSTVALTVTFDPAVLRVRGVQEGSFMRAGGVSATFEQQVDQGRIDLTVIRDASAMGASGAGLVGAVLFDAVAPGTATLTISGVATGRGGVPVPMQLQPVTVTVEP